MSDELPGWSTNWLSSLPLILMTVMIHVFGLVAIRNAVIDRLDRAARLRRFSLLFPLIMGVTVLLITMLHGIKAGAWGTAYVLLGALPDARTAMLYSLSAMTTYGHASIYLEPHWQMMGAVEALNGAVLFGLTTASLFSLIESVSKAHSSRR